MSIWETAKTSSGSLTSELLRKMFDFEDNPPKPYRPVIYCSLAFYKRHKKIIDELAESLNPNRKGMQKKGRRE